MFLQFNIGCLSVVAEKEELPQLPGFGGIVNASVPSHIMMAGGALPSVQPGQMNAAPQALPNNVSVAQLQQQPQPQLPPGVQIAQGNIQAGVQLMMQGQHTAAMQGSRFIHLDLS